MPRISAQAGNRASSSGHSLQRLDRLPEYHVTSSGMSKLHDSTFLNNITSNNLSCHAYPKGIRARCRCCCILAAKYGWSCHDHDCCQLEAFAFVFVGHAAWIMLMCVMSSISTNIHTSPCMNTTSNITPHSTTHHRITTSRTHTCACPNSMAVWHTA